MNETLSDKNDVVSEGYLPIKPKNADAFSNSEGNIIAPPLVDAISKKTLNEAKEDGDKNIKDDVEEEEEQEEEEEKEEEEYEEERNEEVEEERKEILADENEQIIEDLNKSNLDEKLSIESTAKYDIPNLVDFDAEALALDKRFFQDYSEDDEHDKKIQYLTSNFEFLQTQHHTVMSCLHKEVDELKQKNLELNLKLTELTTQRQNEKKPKFQKAKDIAKLIRASSSPIKEDLSRRVVKLQTENDSLKESLNFYKQENKKLANVLQRYKIQSNCDGKEVAYDNRGSCHSIIKHLNEINEQNINKIIRLKSDLYGALNDQELPLSAFIKSKGFHETETKKENCGLLKRFNLPKLPRLKKTKDTKSSLNSENPSGVLLPPLRNQEKEKAIRPQFRP